MTKQERAERWFSNIENAESISMEKKMEICSKVAKKMMVVFLAIFLAECVLLFLLTGGEIFNRMADFLNNVSEGTLTGNQRKGVAIVGGITCLPFVLLPLIVIVIFRNKWIKSEVDKVIFAMNNRPQQIENKGIKQFDFFEKKLSDWTLEIDGEKQKNFTIKRIEHQLEAIEKGDTEFMILTPLRRMTIQGGNVLSFVQLCRDNYSEYFHFEIGTRDENNDDVLIYGKELLNKEEVINLFAEFLKGNTIPDIQDWEIVVDIRTERDIEILKKIAELMTNDGALLSALEGCFNSPKQYLAENFESYQERFFEGDESENQIIWIGIADEMLADGIAVELDWKTEKEDFLQQVKELSDKYYLELHSEWIHEKGDIPTWCKVLDEKWEKQGFCIGSIDIDSDSYVIFICRNEILQKLIALSKKINHRFDFARNM